MSLLKVQSARGKSLAAPLGSNLFSLVVRARWVVDRYRHRHRYRFRDRYRCRYRCTGPGTGPGAGAGAGRCRSVGR